MNGQERKERIGLTLYGTVDPNRFFSLTAKVDDVFRPVGRTVPERDDRVGIIHDFLIPAQGRTLTVPRVVGQKFPDRDVMVEGVLARAPIDPVSAPRHDFINLNSGQIFVQIYRQTS